MSGRLGTDFKLPELGDAGEKRVEGQRQSKTEKTEFRMRRKDGSTAWVIYASSPFFDKALRSGEVVPGDEVVIRRGDGSYATLSSSAAPIKDGQGLAIAGVAVVSDITERRRAVEARAVQCRAAAVRLRRVARPPGTAEDDHKLPGPLNKKYGNELNDQAREYMAYVLDGAARMRELINDLLQYSRIDTQGRPLLEVNLDLVADKVIDNMQDAITEGKATVTKEPLPDVWGDPTQISLLLQSLIGNALKFRGPEAPNIDIFSKQADGEWIIGVKDNGIGVDLKYKDKLFLMFQRLHSRQEYAGTGIGLAISKKIVEPHGGRIWVESDGKSGSTFLFTIPKLLGGAKKDEQTVWRE